MPTTSNRYTDPKQVQLPPSRGSALHAPDAFNEEPGDNVRSSATRLEKGAETTVEGGSHLHHSFVDTTAQMKCEDDQLRPVQEPVEDSTVWRRILGRATYKGTLSIPYPIHPQFDQRLLFLLGARGQRVTSADTEDHHAVSTTHGLLTSRTTTIHRDDQVIVDVEAKPSSTGILAVFLTVTPGAILLQVPLNAVMDATLIPPELTLFLLHLVVLRLWINRLGANARNTVWRTLSDAAVMACSETLSQTVLEGHWGDRGSWLLRLFLPSQETTVIETTSPLPEVREQLDAWLLTKGCLYTRSHESTNDLLILEPVYRRRDSGPIQLQLGRTSDGSRLVATRRNQSVILYAAITFVAFLIILAFLFADTGPVRLIPLVHFVGWSFAISIGLAAALAHVGKIVERPRYLVAIETIRAAVTTKSEEQVKAQQGEAGLQ